jgi:NADPH:quinone reductase-like Zn-dependent oxidoreductase
MKEVIVHPTPELWTEIHEVPIPEPGLNEVVIKVIVAGSNPKGNTLLSCLFSLAVVLIRRQIGST